MLKREPDSYFGKRHEGIDHAVYQLWNGTTLILNMDVREAKKIVRVQDKTPVQIARQGGKTWWMFKGGFYSDDGVYADEGYTEEELETLVQATIVEDHTRRERKLRRAKTLLHQGDLEDQCSPHRQAIPDDVQDRVWKRDGGRCVKCGSRENLEFDHIIPLSKGGSNTARNVQLLCQNCNRSKGNTMG